MYRQSRNWIKNKTFMECRKNYYLSSGSLFEWHISVGKWVTSFLPRLKPFTNVKCQVWPQPLFIFQITVKIRIHDQTRSRTLYKLIYRGIFYPAFFMCACERSFETASFCLKFWLFSSRRPRKLILSIFSKSKRPFEKQTTPRLVTYLCLSMDKIWAKMIFWLWPRNFDFARFLLTDICS